MATTPSKTRKSPVKATTAPAATPPLPEHPTVNLAVVSPVRNEARLVGKTLDAMVAQTLWPREWLFVDDGSTDDTRKIIEEYAARYPWIRVVARADRGFRQLGSGVIAAFDDARR